MTPASMYILWKQGSWLSWPTVQLSTASLRANQAHGSAPNCLDLIDKYFYFFYDVFLGLISLSFSVYVRRADAADRKSKPDKNLI